MKNISSFNNKVFLYFCRGNTSLNAILPLIDILENKSLTILYGKNFNLSNFDMHIINKSNTSKIEYFFNIYEKFILLLNRYVKSKNFRKIISKYICTNYTDKLTELLIKHIGTEKNKIFYLIFDHSDNDYIKSIISKFRERFGNNCIAISISQGELVLTNKMVNDFDIYPITSNYSFFNKVVCSNEDQYKLFEGNKIILRDLGSTKEWHEKISDFFISKKNKNIEVSYNSNFLILHSNSYGNINIKEYKRTYMIFKNSKFKNFYFRPHPVNGKKELIKILGNNFNQCKENTLSESLLNSDIVVAIQSQAIFQALLMRKPVVVLAYMTSNKLSKILNTHCVVLYSPQELYDLLILEPKILWEKFRQLSYIYQDGYNYYQLKNKWLKLLNLNY